MVIISDTASATKSRFGFHDRSSDPALPDLAAKSTSRENLAHSQALAIRSDPDDGGVGGSGLSTQGFELREDPSFWKDHNVQVRVNFSHLIFLQISIS